MADGRICNEVVLSNSKHGPGALRPEGFCTVKLSVYPRTVCVKPRPTLQCGPGLHYSVDLRIQTHTEPVPLKQGKLAGKCSWIYGYFCTVCVRKDSGSKRGASSLPAAVVWTEYAMNTHTHAAWIMHDSSTQNRPLGYCRFFVKDATLPDVLRPRISDVQYQPITAS